MEQFHFPSWWNVNDERLSHVGSLNGKLCHGSGNALFGDWGRLGNVYVRPSKNNIDMTFQFDCKCIFTSNHKPFYLEKKDVKEECNEFTNEHLFIAEREENLNQYRHLQKITDNVFKCSNRQKLESYIKSFNEGASLQTLNRKSKNIIPMSVVYAADNYSHLLSVDKVNEVCKTNSAMYTGGCIKTFILNGKVFIARCSGIALNILCIDQYNLENNSIEHIYTYLNEEAVPTNICSPIYEIDALVLKHECRLLLRRSNTLTLLTVTLEEDVIHVKDVGMKFQEETLPWLCGRLSILWEDELATTSSDVITINDIVTQKQIWRMNSQCLSPVIDSWNELKPLLPMQWIFANRAHCSIIDSRKNPFKAAKDLFSVRNPTLSANESLCHISDIFDTHYFYLFSSFNSNLLDIRMPNKQVSQWTNPILNPVSYSSISEGTTYSDLNFVIGTQMDARHAIFSQNVSTLSKSTCLRSDDPYGELPMSLGLSSIYDAQRRLISVLTLDHRGEILYHGYKSDSSSSISTDIEECKEEKTTLQPIVLSLDVNQKWDFPEEIKQEKIEKTQQILIKVEDDLKNVLQPNAFKNSDVFNLI